MYRRASAGVFGPGSGHLHFDLTRRLLGNLWQFHVQNAILTPFDQTSLNGQLIFANLVPTSENLCIEIHRILRERWRELPSGKKAWLQGVRLEETSSNFFEYSGDA